MRQKSECMKKKSCIKKVRFLEGAERMWTLLNGFLMCCAIPIFTPPIPKTNEERIITLLEYSTSKDGLMNPLNIAYFY